MTGQVRRQVAEMLRRGRGEVGAEVATSEAEVRTSEPRQGRRRGPARKRAAAKSSQEPVVAAEPAAEVNGEA